MKISKLIVCFLLTLAVFSLVAQTKKPFIRFKENGKYGLVDTSGNVIIEGYDYLDKDSKGFIGADKGDIRYVLNDDFKAIFQGEYKSISVGAIKNQFIVEKGNKYGVVDAKHKIVLPFKYDYIQAVSDYYQVRLENQYGIANAKGEIVVPIRYKDITAKNINKNIPIMVEDEHGKALIDVNNKVIISPFEYDYLISATENFIIANSNRTDYFLLNATGEKSIGPFDKMEHYSDVGKKMNRGFILAVDYSARKYKIYNDETLNLVDTYDGISSFNVDFAAVKKGGKYGFINRKVELFISPQYDEAFGFNEGLAPVIKDGKWGVVNEKNEIVIPFQFVGYIGPFKNGVAEYRKGPVSKFNYTWFKNGLINTKGEIIAEPIY